MRPFSRRSRFPVGSTGPACRSGSRSRAAHSPRADSVGSPTPTSGPPVGTGTDRRFSLPRSGNGWPASSADRPMSLQRYRALRRGSMDRYDAVAARAAQARGNLVAALRECCELADAVETLDGPELLEVLVYIDSLR